MSTKFEREIQIRPADDTPHGFHACEVIFILRGPAGVVTLALLSDWHAKHLQEQASRGLGQRRLSHGIQPSPLEFAFHSPKPTDNVRGTKRTDCPYIDGDCYSSYSPQTAEYLRNILLAQGSDSVWFELEQRYRSAAVVTQSAQITTITSHKE